MELINMNFMSLVTYAVSRKSIQRKYTACLQGDEVLDTGEALLTMTDEVTTLKR